MNSVKHKVNKACEKIGQQEERELVVINGRDNTNMSSLVRGQYKEGRKGYR